MRAFSPVVALIMAVLMSGAALALSPGTTFSGTINQTVDTANAYIGQQVSITNASAPGAGIYNATMYGTVTHLVRAGQGRPAELRITLHTLRLSNGAQYAISGVVTGWKAQTRRNTLKEIGGAVAGMLVGNVLGAWVLGSTLHGVAGAAGAAGGFLLAKNNRQNMVVGAGSQVQVELLSARRQSSVH